MRLIFSTEIRKPKQTNNVYKFQCDMLPANCKTQIATSGVNGSKPQY